MVSGDGAEEEGSAAESGDWLTLGVLKAPVDCRWSRSKISCSSLGRRGGAGALANGCGGLLLPSAALLRVVHESARSCRGAIAMRLEKARVNGRRVDAIAIISCGCS